MAWVPCRAKRNKGHAICRRLAGGRSPVQTHAQTSPANKQRIVIGRASWTERVLWYDYVRA